MQQVRDDTMRQALAECAALVKAENLDAWLATLLAPRGAQPPLLAQWAIVAEVARLPWRLHEPLLARLRGEWWRESLQELSNAEVSTTPPTVPPLRLLHAAHLDPAPLAEAVAHLALLADSVFTSADQAAAFAREAFRPLLHSLILALDPDATPHTTHLPLDELARAAGAAFLLRRLPYPRATQPAALMPPAAACDLADLALKAHDAARAVRWPRPWLPALWPASLWLRWLRKARRHPGFPERMPLPPSRLRRQLTLLGLRLRWRV